MRAVGSAFRLLGAATLLLTQAAAGQDSPTAFTPKKTAWGDPDFRGVWPIDRVSDANIPLERSEAFGDRLVMTDEEFAKRLDEAKASDAEFANEVVPEGSIGLAEWLQSTPFGRRTSLIVSPANGRIPSLTPQAEALHKAGRTSWHTGQPINWVTDLDSYDRCVSRGFPTSMLPAGSNNGIRVFQSPGVVVLQLEVLGTRVIPVGQGERWPEAVRSWLGQSRGRWEGNTLVIETANIVAGDSASYDVTKRAATPLSGRTRTTLPMSKLARTVERLTMTGPDTIAYQVTYTDPDVFTAPWTVEIEWTRDDGYQLHEFACHEGNVQVRHMITATHALRKQGGEAATASRPEDGTGRWPFPASSETAAP